MGCCAEDKVADFDVLVNYLASLLLLSSSRRGNKMKENPVQIHSRSLENKVRTLKSNNLPSDQQTNGARTISALTKQSRDGT